MLDSQQKHLMRAAMAIHSQLSAPQPTAIELPDQLWRQLHAINQRRKIACNRDWRAAEKKIGSELCVQIHLLRCELAAIESQLQTSHQQKLVASPADIFRDLAALYDEFEEVNVNLRGKRLTVVTESIELDRYYLGPFEIELKWPYILLNSTRRYGVFARDPQPANSNSDVTHPHVSGESLCEGDGGRAIDRALTEGRLFDFFSIVRNTLNTYNAESAYVRLDDWEGTPCSDCGELAGAGESYCCEQCEYTVCGECGRLCIDCHETLCNDCVLSCATCEDDLCKRCHKQCERCEKPSCETCFTSTNICEKCHEKEIEDADAEVQSDSVGETVVSA